MQLLKVPSHCEDHLIHFRIIMTIFFLDFNWAMTGTFTHRLLSEHGKSTGL